MPVENNRDHNHPSGHGERPLELARVAYTARHNGVVVGLEFEVTPEHEARLREALTEVWNLRLLSVTFG